MFLIALGMIIFAAGHLIPVWSPNTKNILSQKIGIVGYKILYILISISGLWLLTIGWKNANYYTLYDLGKGTMHLQLILMPLAFILFFSSFVKSWTGTFIRHQQLTAVKLWAVGHLLANGDSRSLIMFGGFLIWAVLMVIGIKKRDGSWYKPRSFSFIMTGAALIIGLIVFYAVASHHSLIFGVSALPDWAH